MAEYRTIRMGFWTDPYIEQLEAHEKLLYLYLFSCPYTTNLGIIEITQKRIAFETGIPIKEIAAGIERLTRDKKIVVDDGKIWLTRFIKHQTTTSPRIIDSLKKELFEVTSKNLKHTICMAYPHLFEGSTDAPQDGSDTIPDRSDTPSDGMHSVSIPSPYPMDRVCIPSAEREREEEREEEENTCSAKIDCEPTGSPAPTPPAPVGAENSQLCLRGKKQKLTGKRAEFFVRLWEAFGDKRGKADAIDAVAGIPTLTDGIAAHILYAAKRYAQDDRPTIQAKNGTPKMLQGWLTARRWEDYSYPPPAQQRASPAPEPEPPMSEEQRKRNLAMLAKIKNRITNPYAKEATA